MKRPFISPTDECSVDGCTVVPHARGWCVRHYWRWKNHGDPTAEGPGSHGPEAVRFMRFVRTNETGCWLWQGKTNRAGYGYFSADGRSVQTHRWSYEHHVGPIPAGLQIDHLCRVRNCVNPAHLEAVTPRENTLRSTATSAVNARKTHCNNGHLFDDANTYITPKGGRACRTCGRKTQARYAARRAS